MAGLAAKELKALIEVGTSLGYVGDELKQFTLRLTAAFIAMIRVVDFFRRRRCGRFLTAIVTVLARLPSFSQVTLNNVSNTLQHIRGRQGNYAAL